ncbi:MAG: efflux RND transporter periplasmic adaptor subunit [Planctomycetota bacterium]|jgi:multidrug resistance efflux pump
MLVRYCVFLILSALGLCAIGCARSGADQARAAAGNANAAKIPVTLARVERADLAATVELVGSLLPRRRTVIVAEVDGVIRNIAKIEKIPERLREQYEALVSENVLTGLPSIDIGAEVKKGQEIVWLDPSEYNLKLAAAQARLTSAQRELEKLRAWRRAEEIRSAQATRDEAAAGLTLAQADFDRARKLVARDAVTQSEYDRTEAALKTARAGLERAEADLALAKAGPTKEDLAVAEAAVAQAAAEVDRAEWEVERTVIRAPYDGVVTDRYVDEGDRVTALPRVEIMEIMDLSLLTAQLGVPERHIGQIEIGDSAQVHVKGSVEPVPGIVALMNDKVDPTSRTFRIRVSTRNDERKFKVGQFVEVALQVESAPRALTIPAGAITYAGGEAHVFVHGQGRVHEKDVELGVSNREAVEVLSGLAEGEQVVVDDPSVLANGMSVEVRSASTKP